VPPSRMRSSGVSRPASMQPPLPLDSNAEEKDVESVTAERSAPAVVRGSYVQRRWPNQRCHLATRGSREGPVTRAHLFESRRLFEELEFASLVARVDRLLV
jgi:hypothetical protein